MLAKNMYLENFCAKVSLGLKFSNTFSFKSVVVLWPKSKSYSPAQAKVWPDFFSKPTMSIFLFLNTPQYLSVKSSPTTPTIEGLTKLFAAKAK